MHPRTTTRRTCAQCGEEKLTALCHNPGCPEVAHACTSSDGYCCRCFESARIVAAEAASLAAELSSSHPGQRAA